MEIFDNKILQFILKKKDVRQFVFPGGEVQITLPEHIVEFPITGEESFGLIDWDIRNSDDVMALALTVDALRRRFFGCKLALLLKYFPYARQDRVCAPGQALGAAVMASIINSLGFHMVKIWDAHSDVSEAMLNNCINIPQWQLVEWMDRRNCVLVAPDAGAIKKVSVTAKKCNAPFVRADKTRDPSGVITGTVVYSPHIGDQDFLILDDICDGGRTFIELAKVLRPLTDGKIKLYVTHGIFSRGLDVFDGLIDEIYVANPFVDVSNHPNYKVISE